MAMSIPSGIRVVLLLLLHNRMATALAGTTTTVNVTITTTQGVPAPTRTATTFVTVIVTSRPTTTIFLTESHPWPSATEAISQPSTEYAVFSATSTPSVAPTSSVHVSTTFITSSTTSALPTPSTTPPSMSASFDAPTLSTSASILTPTSSFASASVPSPSASSESALLAPATTSLTASTPPSVSASSLIFSSTEGTAKSSTLSLATLATTPPTTTLTTATSTSSSKASSTSASTSKTSTISTHPLQTTATRPLTTATPSPTDPPPRSNDSSFGLSTGQITGIVFGIVGATLLLVFAVILIRRRVQRHGAVTELAAAASLNAYDTSPGTLPLLQPPATIYASSRSALPTTAAVMPTSAWSSASDDESSHQQDASIVSVSPDIRQQYLWYQRYIDEGNGVDDVDGVDGVESGADEVAAAVARELELPPQSGLSSRRVSQVPSSTALGEWMSGSDAEDGHDGPDDGSEDHMSFRRYHGQAL